MLRNNSFFVIWFIFFSRLYVLVFALCYSSACFDYQNMYEYKIRAEKRASRYNVCLPFIYIIQTQWEMKHKQQRKINQQNIFTIYIMKSAWQTTKDDEEKKINAEKNINSSDELCESVIGSQLCLAASNNYNRYSERKKTNENVSFTLIMAIIDRWKWWRSQVRSRKDVDGAFFFVSVDVAKRAQKS